MGGIAHRSCCTYFLLAYVGIAHAFNFPQIGFVFFVRSQIGNHSCLGPLSGDEAMASTDMADSQSSLASAIQLQGAMSIAMVGDEAIGARRTRSRTPPQRAQRARSRTPTCVPHTGRPRTLKKCTSRIHS